MSKRPYDQPKGKVHVYRFNDWVAVSLPFSERTLYLSPSEAMGLSIVLKRAAEDCVDQKSFVDSKLAEETVAIG